MGNHPALSLKGLGFLNYLHNTLTQPLGSWDGFYRAQSPSMNFALRYQLAFSTYALAALVTRFYAKARRDPLLGPVFESAVEDWDEHLRTLNAFWSSVMLTSGRYKGNPMAAHMKLPIDPRFFERWLALWRETAAESFEPEPAAQFAQKAGRIAESLKLALFYRPGAVAEARPPR